LRNPVKLGNGLVKGAGSKKRESSSEVAESYGDVVTTAGFFVRPGKLPGGLPERSDAGAVVFVGDQTAEVMDFLNEPLALI
jgi:hypothetical protein